MVKKGILIILVFSFLFSCKRDKNEITEDSLGEDTVDVIDTPKLKAVNFYLENSDSMDPYTVGNTNFIRANVKLLSDLALILDSDSIKLNTVNMEPYPLKHDYTYFNDYLTTRGIYKEGDTKNSDINLIFSKILNKNNKGEVSILVTDAIYSIDDAKEKKLSCDDLISRLQTKSDETRNLFYKRLENSDFSMLVLKMKSSYKGFYYPAQGGRVNINQERPYYIFLFGNSYLLKNLNDKLVLNDLPGYNNDLFVLKTNPNKIDYSILEYGDGKIGEFKNANSHKYPIHEIEFGNVGKRGENINEFGFTIAIDLSNIPLPDRDLIDLGKYEDTSKDYEVYKIKSIENDNVDEQTKELIIKTEKKTNANYTHLLFVKTDKEFIQNFEINLINRTPTWVEDTGLDCDDNILGETEKTFGFDKMTNKIIEAFERINRSKKHFSINVNIKN